MTVCSTVPDCMPFTSSQQGPSREVRGRPTPMSPLLFVKTMRPFWSYQVSDSYIPMTGN